MTVTIDQIIAYITMLAPSIAAVVAFIITCAKQIKQFTSLRTEVKEKVECEELKKSLENALSEIDELKRLLRKDLESRTNVRGG